MKVGDLVCHRRQATREEKGLGIIINAMPEPGLQDVLLVYWFKEAKEQQVWKQVLRYAK
jgi:hypothetical protein